MKKTIKDRESEFIKQCEPYFEEYGKQMIKEFVEYWTEIGVNDKKMRFEKEKTFGVKRRLSTWAKNDKNWNPPKEEDKKPALQVYQKSTVKKDDVVSYSEMYEIIQNHKKRFLETNVMPLGSYFYYDWLVENGYIQEKIKNLSEVKKQRYESIKSLTLEVLRNKTEGDLRDEMKRKNRIENIERNIDEKVIIEAKESILKDYYSL